ncbi:MAG: GAF domain-containing protein [Desulfobacterales bacterium]|jgi:GAF domain-containing protein
MKKRLTNYDTLLKITQHISQSRDFEDVTLLVVSGLRNALLAKGAALFLIDNKSQELKLVSSAGLSDEYLDKGPINALRSIADSLKDGPVAISNVADDPRIQYPAEAQKEGIASILSVPIIAREKPVGAIRVYTSEPWEVTLDDVNFVQAVAQISGMALETARLYKGLKNSIEILKANRDPSQYRTGWTPHEGVPKSVEKDDAQPAGI